MQTAVKLEVHVFGENPGDEFKEGGHLDGFFEAAVEKEAYQSIEAKFLYSLLEVSKKDRGHYRLLTPFEGRQLALVGDVTEGARFALAREVSYYGPPSRPIIVD